MHCRNNKIVTPFRDFCIFSTKLKFAFRTKSTLTSTICNDMIRMYLRHIRSKEIKEDLPMIDDKKNAV